MPNILANVNHLYFIPIGIFSHERMPEGPEVETVRRGLLNVCNLEITKVIVANHKKYHNLKKIEPILNKAKILDIRRKGKFLIFEFRSKSNEDLFGLNHLGMTGIWRFIEISDLGLSYSEIESEFKHFKLYFEFRDLGLVFNDPRTFGRFELYENVNQIENHKSISDLGPDILDYDMDVTDFISRVRGKNKTRVKEIGKVLLDPNVIAGCGNIYKSEALFDSNIDPFTPSHKISNKKLKTLAKSLVKVGNHALKSGGSTISDFNTVEGYEGLMQNEFNVYSREGEQCYICETTILAKKQGDRTTFWCPSCQK